MSRINDYIADGEDPEYYPSLSLNKLLGSEGSDKIKDIKVRISTEHGFPILQISTVVLESGKEIFAGGEHDFPYLEIKNKMVSRELISELERETRG